MKSAKEHYDQHLAHFDNWMTGDFELKQQEQEEFFRANQIIPQHTGQAVDLGCGHGLQSIALAKIGFQLIAIDFNTQLLNELRNRKGDLSVEVVEDDLLNFATHANSPELIVCMGDTIAHLESYQQLQELLTNCMEQLVEAGKIILSYRDYSTELKGEDRFIPVKADELKILTCVLDFSDDFVSVTDLLHEKVSGNWTQKSSSYQKLRLNPEKVESYLTEAGFTSTQTTIENRMVYTIAQK